MLMIPKVAPVFKWAGGKDRLIANYAPVFFPDQDFDTFVDLFAGALSVTCFVHNERPAAKLHINDINDELIGLYRAMANDYDRVEAEYQDIADGYVRLERPTEPGRMDADRKRYYQDVLQAYAKERTPGRLLFMLQTSFGGHWKAYKKWGGGYSTPVGAMQETPQFFDVARLRVFATMLSKATITCQSYDTLTIPKNAFVYADPPYRTANTDHAAVSVRYKDDAADAWTDTDQAKLAQWLRSSGAAFYAESNSDFGDGFWAAQFPGCTVHPFCITHTAGAGKVKKRAQEVLITSFAPATVGLW